MSLEPEFRRDPVCKRWAVVAPERALRPITLQGTEPRHRRNGERKPCPLCPGQEQETPQEVLAYREPGSSADGPGWQLRVVPNRFPAVRPDVGDTFCTIEGMVFQTVPGFGRSEVIVETPEHVPDPTQLSVDQFALVFRAYRDRIRALAVDERLSYAAVFKNVGAEAGASLGHSHSQIVATPVVPDLITRELKGADILRSDWSLRVLRFPNTGTRRWCSSGCAVGELPGRHRICAAVLTRTLGVAHGALQSL